MSNLGLLLTQGPNGVCPEEMVELSRLAELPVVKLTAADYKTICIFVLKVHRVLLLGTCCGFS